jgi:hypothetical protein
VASSLVAPYSKQLAVLAGCWQHLEYISKICEGMSEVAAAPEVSH